MPQEMYWEDLTVGVSTSSPGRTVTESDLVGFAGLSGDYNAIHTDAIFAAEHGLGGERLVHGLLGLSISSGLFTRTDLGIGMQRQLIAMLSLEWRFAGPLRVDDTVHVRAEVTDRRETAKAERGITLIRRSLLNQRSELIQDGTMTMMIRRRAQD